MLTPPRERRPILPALGIEERDDLEAFLTESRVVGQRETEVAGAEDGDADRAIEAENGAELPLQLLDVVADAAHAELAEVREVLPDLGGVQVELLGQRRVTSLPNRGSKLLTAMLSLRQTLALVFHGIGRRSNVRESDTPFSRRRNSHTEASAGRCAKLFEHRPIRAERSPAVK